MNERMNVNPTGGGNFSPPLELFSVYLEIYAVFNDQSELRRRLLQYPGHITKIHAFLKVQLKPFSLVSGTLLSAVVGKAWRACYVTVFCWGKQLF